MMNPNNYNERIYNDGSDSYNINYNNDGCAIKIILLLIKLLIMIIVVVVVMLYYHNIIIIMLII
jgi:hypothetical protein